MRPEGKKVTRLTKLITDMDTQFVSLVNHGANQRPFAVVKQANILEGDSLVLNNDDTDVSRPDKNSKFAVQKITFDKRYFDENAAKAAVEKLGFSGGFESIETEGDNLIIKSKYADKFDEDTVKSVAGNQPGLHVFVGVPNEDVEKVAEKVAEKKEVFQVNGLTKSEAVEKFDSWVAGWSESVKLGDVLAEGMYDGLPFGAYEMSSSFWTAVANAGRNKDYQAIRQASMELGDLIANVLVTIHNSSSDLSIEKSEEIMDKVLKADKEQKPETETTEDKKTTQVEVTETTETKETEKTTTPSEETEETEAQGDDKVEEVLPAEEPKEDKKEDPKEGDNKPAEDAEDKEVKKSQDLMASITELFKKELSPLASRLDALEGKTGTRKSVEISDEETVKTEKANTEKKIEEQRVFKADADLANRMGGLF